MPGHKGRRGTGGVIAAIIIVLLLLLAVGLYYWEEGYRRKLDQLSALRQERLALQAQASMLVHVGALGNATGENISILVYNGAGFPLSLAALTLVTTTGQVDVINSTHTPAFVAEARAYLYRQGPTGLVLVASYPDLQQAIAKGLVIPQTYLLEINITATQPLEALHTHLGFKAPLTSGSTQALVPIVLQATTTYTSPQQAITGGGGRAPPATTTTPALKCYIPITIINRVNRPLIDYAVRIILNSTNINQTIWNQLDPTKIFITLQNGTPLYYYIEYFNKTEKIAIIWINTTYIPPNSSIKIYIYYNYTNNTYVSYNNPSKVFLYYNSGNIINFDKYPYFEYYKRRFSPLLSRRPKITILGWWYVNETPSAWKINNSYGCIQNYVSDNNTFIDMLALINMSKYSLFKNASCISTYINLNGVDILNNSAGIAIVDGNYSASYLVYYYYNYYYYIYFINNVANYSEVYIVWNTSIGQAELGFYQIGELSFSGLKGYILKIPVFVEDISPNIISPASWYRLSVCIDYYTNKIIINLSYLNYSIIYIKVLNITNLPIPFSPNALNYYVGLEGGIENKSTHLYKNIIIRPFAYPEPKVILGQPTCSR
ncbi:MAG: DUF2341 domain-containing protein [Desulfurococcales archaeon]|nr:DUF2341 domain-containing protein [Desulfurococcales archaeon]